MPLLAGLLLSLFGSLAGFFVQWFTKKVAFAVAAIATFAALTVALYIGMSLLLSGLSVTFPGGVLQTFLWLAVPDSAPVAIAAMIGADTAISLYKWNVENLRLASYVT